MMKLATPISHLFEDKAAAEEISKRSDCLECRDHTFGNTAPDQYVYHCELSVLKRWEQREKASLRWNLGIKNELTLVSFHMEACCSDPILKENMYFLGGDSFSIDQMLDNAQENIKWLKGLIHGRNIHIAVENNNYYPTSAYEYITEANFISQIVKDNGIRFLFDLAHAKITAHNRAIAYQDYIRQLPMKDMIQIHVSKHKINEQGLACDAHALPDTEIFEEVDRLVSDFLPEYLTIEYYKDTDNLARVLEQYKQLGSSLERQISG